MSDFYGINNFKSNSSLFDTRIEEIKINGFTVIEGILAEDDLKNYREAIDRIYFEQEKKFGRDNLKKINELDMARCLLAYDKSFIRLAIIPEILKIIEFFIGEYFILNLQNAIINHPNKKHHQTSWHRDLPYQNWVISKPISMNCLFAIDPYSEETGSTQVVPFTHNLEEIPSENYCEKYKVSVSAPPGSAIVFNSMLFHRAGNNSANIIRRAVNQIYTVPIIKQQIDIPSALGDYKPDDLFLRRFLGFESNVPRSELEWRTQRAERIVK